MDERCYMVGLSRIKGLGPRRLELLLSVFGSAQDIWLAKTSQLYCIKEIPTPVIDELIRVRQKTDLAGEIGRLADKGINVYTIVDESYPQKLRNIHTPPLVLYVRGEPIAADVPVIALVGARRSTPYGLKVAEELAQELAKAGVIVVSGMARGVDTAAHRGCLNGGSKTVAVLGTGVDVVYPRENKQLMDRIIASGAVYSEFPPGTRAEPNHFPRRNRIISGLAEGVVVIEAAETSGSLITADLALEQGKDVFAVPGSIYSPQSRGTNRLIKQGAKLVDSVEDVLEELGLTSSSNRNAQPQGGSGELSESESRILSRLSLTPVNIEGIVEYSGMSPADVSGTLTFLELKGLVKRLPGQWFVSNV